jgi:hypothetical protein
MADPQSYRKAVAVTNKRHDLIAIDLQDPFDQKFEAVGLLAIEDPETGDLAWIDTNSRSWRSAFQKKISERKTEFTRALNQAGVDRISVETGQDYTKPLAGFFKERTKRIRH